VCSSDLTQGRLEAQNQVLALIQTTLDSYESGIFIKGVKLEKADPPPAVIDAFEEVQRAEQNQNKFIREAESYRAYPGRRHPLPPGNTAYGR